MIEFIPSIWLFAVIAVCVALFIYGARPRLRWQFRRIPGPEPTWLLGNLPDIVRFGKHIAFQKWGRRYGSVYKVFEGGILTLVIEDPVLGHYIASRLPNRHPIPSLEIGEEARFNAAGILFARDAHHRGLRAAWQPMFHSASLDAFFPIMQSAADALVLALESDARDGKPIDIWRRLEDFTMNVAGESAFGVDMQKERTLAAGATAFFKAAGQIEGIYALLQVCFPHFTPFIRHMANVLPTPTYAAGRAGRLAVKEAVAALLDQHRRKEANNDSITENKAGNKDVSATGSFLVYMSRGVNKETGAPFSDMEVICQAFSFVLAAFETTSATLAFAIHLLSSHQDKLAKMLAEVDAFGQSRLPVKADLTNSQFPYVEAVLKETLRLYPAVPLAIREADKDIVLGQDAVPRGTHLAVNLYAMHRNPSLWDDPDDFIPERFLGDGPPAKAMAAYMPFGDGPRGCVGTKYAWQETLLALVRMYQKYVFRLSPGQIPLEVHMSLSLTPRNGVWVTPFRRD